MERFCRQQFQIWWKWQKVIQMGRKHYQTTNFRLIWTERFCRRQFQIWWKWQKVIQMGRKHYGKRRNCSLWAISPFPIVFSKGLFPRGINRCHWGNGLKSTALKMKFDSVTYFFLKQNPFSTLCRSWQIFWISDRKFGPKKVHKGVSMIWHVEPIFDLKWPFSNLS